MRRYILTEKAVEDLSGIWEYTYNLWSEKQADFYYESIIQVLNNIVETNHNSSKTYFEIGSGFFGRKVNRHIIVYRELDDQVILVLRILHERMDLKNKDWDQF